MGGTHLFWTRFPIGNLSILPDLFRHDPISEMWSQWGEGWEVKSHMNPPSSCAFFRTSSKEDPAGTEMECVYGGQTLGTVNMT